MRILYVEPFARGSHAMFTQVLTAGLPAAWTRLELPGRHWKWRMRGSAVFAALEHAEALRGEYDLVFASSYLPLAELCGLCPQLQGVPRVLYFHENQLHYPVRHAAPRDHHYGFTQMVSALAASVCAFNSAYNRDTFLAGARALLRRMPDAIPRDWVETIAARSEVWALPLELPVGAPALAQASADQRGMGPCILWNHRWEHDKHPEAFFSALFELHARGVPFRVAVCGERFRSVPWIFEVARTRLADRIDQFGPIAGRAEYEALLGRADLAVSTAAHEFFGIAVLEATHFGARPLVPDALAYPELFPPEYRYREGELTATLERLCRAFVNGDSLRGDRRELTARFSAAHVLPRYAARLRELIAAQPRSRGS